MIRQAAALCCAASLAGCGLVPRSDYSEGAAMSRIYAMDYVRLASCAYDQLDKIYINRVSKADFPDRQSVRLWHQIDFLRVWTVEITAESRGRAKVFIPIPPNVGAVQPERLLQAIDACAPTLG